MNELFYNIISAVILALVGIVTKELIPYLRKKKAEADAQLKRTRWGWVTEITDAAVRAVEQTASDSIHGTEKKQRAATLIKDALDRQGYGEYVTNEQILQLIEAAVQEMNSQDIKIEEPVLEEDKSDAD